MRSLTESGRHIHVEVSVMLAVVLTANRLEGVTGGKSNVFVVQKAGKVTGASTAIHVTTTVPSVISSAFEKVRHPHCMTPSLYISSLYDTLTV